MVVGQDPQIVVVESHVLLAVWHKVEAIVRLVESPDLHDRAPGDVQSPVDHRHHHMNGTRQIHADHPQGEDILVVESLEPHPSTPTLEAAQPIPADHHEEGQVVVEVLVGFRQLLVPGGHKSGGGQGAGLTPNPPVGPFPLCTALPFSSVRSVPFRSALRSRHDSSTFLLLLLPLPLRLRLRLLVKVPALLGPLSQSMLTAAAAPAARESQSCGVATFGEFRFSPSCSDSNLANFENIFFFNFCA